MKTISIIIISLLVGATQQLYPQETARERIEQRLQAEAAEGSSRRSIPGGQQHHQLNELIENAKWSRIIYRYIDLMQPVNAPLYYPETASEDGMNLFSSIFRLLQNNEIKAYEYLDGRELFTDEYQIHLPEFMDRFGIYYETVNGSIVVHDADIPSHEVLGYYIKELCYFDTPTSSLKVIPTAICPVIHRQDNREGLTRYPLFWVPYSRLEMHARQMPIVSSSLNNSTRGTVDDFFRMRRYNGEIYKTGNPANPPISRYTSSPEEMRAEQDRIEQELIDFERHLWQGEVVNQGPQSQLNPGKGTRQQNRRIIIRSESSGSTRSMRDRRY